MTCKHICTLTLTNGEIDTIAEAHDLLQRIDQFMFSDENANCEFTFNRNKVSGLLIDATQNISDAMEAIIGHENWVNWAVMK